MKRGTHAGLRFLLCSGLLAMACGCNPIQSLNEGIEHSKAVSAALEKSTGLKSQVGFNYQNGKLASVNVMFQGAPANVSLPELADKSRAAVQQEFKDTPEQLILGFVFPK